MKSASKPDKLHLKIDEILSGKVLQVQPFGYSEQFALWLEASSLRDIALQLKESEELAFDWLENLSIMQMDEAVIATYFLRSTRHHETLILRVSASLPGTEARLSLPGAGDIWTMACPFETEASSLWGIDFSPSAPSSCKNWNSHLLPESLKGFPLRKDYQFPSEVAGIRHERPSPAPSTKSPKLFVRGHA